MGFFRKSLKNSISLIGLVNVNNFIIGNECQISRKLSTIDVDGDCEVTTHPTNHDNKWFI